MLKNWLGISLSLLLISSLLAGCGIPQEQHDAVIAERDEVLAQLNATGVERDELKTQLNSTVVERDKAKTQLNATVVAKDEAKAQVTALENELNELKTVLLKTQTSLETAENNYGELVSNLQKTHKELEALIEADALIMRFWSDSGKFAAGLISNDEMNSKTTIFEISLGIYLSRTGNDSLSQHWENAAQAASRNDSKTFTTEFVLVMDLLTDLVKEKLDTLGRQIELYSLRDIEA